MIVTVFMGCIDRAYAMGDPPPPVQSSITATVREWVAWWWGIRPHVKTRRTYIGGDG